MLRVSCSIPFRSFASPQRRQLTTQQQWHQPLGHDTGIKVYNCIKRQMVPIILRNENFATWYTCGPTVYDSSHLGHASCYVKLDIIQRILKQHFGINLVTAMNITDIDDKIIAKSHETKRDWRELSKMYEAEFWADLRKLNVPEPNLKISVTENVPKIVSFIDKIIQKRNAYVGNDNSVYFNVKTYPNYGKLLRLNIDSVESSQLENKTADADFALWKARKSLDEPSWESPWGLGRPGWHIECSVLASMIFGECIDFHAGGIDLKFPHHENEEAQSCVYHDNEQWVNYWIHTGHLSTKGQREKMSKSLKNTISIEQMLSNYSSDVFRMACLLSNYRNSMEYSDELMESSKSTLLKFKSFKTDCRAYLDGKKLGSNIDSNNIIQLMKQTSINIDACLRHDFDTARTVGLLSELTNNVSRCINAPTNSLTSFSASSCDVIAAVDNFVDKTLRTYGFILTENYQSMGSTDDTQIDLNALLEDILVSRKVIRDKALQIKSKELFQVCDDLRNCLKQHGIEIKDHSQGSTWSFSLNKK